MRCERPVTYQRAENDLRVAVRCGRCQECLKMNQLGWVLRMLLESRSSDHAIFSTLTYEVSPVKLDYSHISKFLKRYRKSFPGSVRFFCCGEYGLRGRRPHWHTILFSRGHQAAPTQQCVTTAWQQGFVHVGDATPQSMAYVAKYALKTHTSVSSPNRTPVARMSRRPGLGLQESFGLGLLLGRQQKEVEQLPTWLRIGGRWYPMDRSCRVHFRAGFASSGGLELRSRSALGLDLEAAMYDRVGGVLTDARRGSMELVRRRIRELERGTL